MKRMIIIVVIAVITSNALEGSSLKQKDNFHHNNKRRFLDAADEYDAVRDEYTHDEGGQDQQNIDDYDQHVCDDAQSPKISSIEALFREIAGFVFVRYIILREMMSVYGHEIKEALSKWFNMLVKA